MQLASFHDLLSAHRQEGVLRLEPSRRENVNRGPRGHSPLADAGKDSGLRARTLLFKPDTNVDKPSEACTTASPPHCHRMASRSSPP
jgi:hypothetical protein